MNKSAPIYIKGTSSGKSIPVPLDLIEDGTFTEKILRYQYLLNPDPTSEFIFEKIETFADHRFRLIEGWFERMVVASNGHSSNSSGRSNVVSMDSVEKARGNPQQASFSQKLIRRCSPWFSELADFCDHRLRTIQSSCIRNLALGNIFSIDKGVGIPGFLGVLHNQITRKGDETLGVYVSEDTPPGKVPSSSETTCTLHPWLTNLDALSKDEFKYRKLLPDELPKVLTWHGPHDFYLATEEEQKKLLSLIDTLNQAVPLESFNIRFEFEEDNEEQLSNESPKLPKMIRRSQKEDKGFFVKTLMNWLNIGDVLPEVDLNKQFLHPRISLDVPKCVYNEDYDKDQEGYYPYYHLANISKPTTRLEMWTPWLSYVLAGSITSRFYSFNKVSAEINHCKTSVTKTFYVSAEIPPLGSSEWAALVRQMKEEGGVEVPYEIETEYMVETYDEKKVDEAEVKTEVEEGYPGTDQIVNTSYFSVVQNSHDRLIREASSYQIIGDIIPVDSEEYPFKHGDLWGPLCKEGFFEIPFYKALEHGIIYCTSLSSENTKTQLTASTQVTARVQEPASSEASSVVEVSSEPNIISYPSEFARQHYIESLLFGIAVPRARIEDHSYDGSDNSGGQESTDSWFTRGLVLHVEKDIEGSQDVYQESYLQWVTNIVEGLVDPDESSIEEVKEVTGSSMGEAKKLIEGYMGAGQRAEWIKSQHLDKVEVNPGLTFVPEGEPMIKVHFGGPLVPVSVIQSGDPDLVNRYISYIQEPNNIKNGEAYSLTNLYGNPDPIEINTGCMLTVTHSGVPDTFPRFSAGFDIGRYFGAAEFSKFRFAPPQEWASVVAGQCKPPTLDTSSDL